MLNKIIALTKNNITRRQLPHILEITLLIGCALLLWKLSRDDLVLPFPWLAVWLTVLLVLLLPGFVLLRLLDPAANRPWFAWLPYSLGLGLAWLMLPLASVFFFEFDVAHLVRLVPYLNGLLLVAYGLLHLAGKLPWPIRNLSPNGEGKERADKTHRLNPWLLVGAGGMMVLLIGLFLYSTEPYTFFGDDQGVVPFIQRFLDGQQAGASWDHSWELLQALIIRFSGTELLPTFQRDLPLFLLPLAAFSFLTLADSLFKDRNLTYFSFIIFGLYAISDIRIFEGLGLGLLTRLLEDKFFAWLFVLPLVQAAFLQAVRLCSYRYLALFAILALLAVAIHPIAIVWITFSVGSAGLFFLLFRPNRFLFIFYGAAGAIFSLALLLAWWQRQASQFVQFEDLSDPANAYQVLFNSARRVVFFSLDGAGSFMAHPLQLSHPLVILALVISVALLFKIKHSLAAQFLFSNMAVVVVLLFNPITASWIGHWIGSYQINRVIWLMPIVLTVSLGLYTLIQKGTHFARKRISFLTRHPQSLNFVPLLVSLIIAGVLWPNIAYSRRMLHIWNKSVVTTAERGLLEQLAQLPQGQSSNILVWPEMYTENRTLVRPGHFLYAPESDEFYQTGFITQDTVEALRQHRITHLVVPVDSLAATTLKFMPGPFRLVYQNFDYGLYAWQPGQLSGLNLDLIAGNTRFQAGDLAGAKQAYQHTLQQAPDHLLATLNLGAVYETEQNFEQVKMIYQQAALSSSWLQLRLANNYVHTESDPAATFDVYQQLLDTKSTDPNLYFALIDSFGRLPQQLRQTETGWSIQQRLIEYFQTRADHEPYDYLRQRRLAEIYQQLGLYRAAISQYQLMISNFPQHEEPFEQLAAIYEANNDMEAAVAVYREAIALLPEPGSGMPYLKLSQLYRQQQDYEQALVWAEQARQRSETLHDNHSLAATQLELGYIYQAQQENQSAVKHFRLAAEAQPDSWWYHANVCNFYQEYVNTPAQALPYCRTAAQLAPNIPYNQLSLGAALLATGKIEAGLRSLQQALLLEPNSEEMYQQVKSLVGQYVQSPGVILATLTEMPNLAPDDPQIYLLVGRFLTELNQTPQVITTYQQAIEQGLTIPEIYRQLGAAYEQSGQPEQARQYYEQAQAASEALEP